MTDLEISKDLALAIGWPKSRVTDRTGKEVLITEWPSIGTCRAFDYRDPAVIWPIAKKFNAFPYRLTLKEGGSVGKWNCFCETGRDNVAATPEKAVAMAVINRGRK